MAMFSQKYAEKSRYKSKHRKGPVKVNTKEGKARKRQKTRKNGPYKAMNEAGKGTDQAYFVGKTRFHEGECSTD